MITPEMTKELQDILLRKYGLKTSEKEAFAIGTSLIRYFEILTKNKGEKK